ncbi:MAG: indole-3-glycerol-phosphate synthase [Ignavibacteria bacterium]
MNFLAKVKKYKKSEVKILEIKQSENLFLKLFYTIKNRPVLIGEIKPRSPSGEILFEGDFIKLAKAYEKAGVDAISVLTDSQTFGGSIELLNEIRRNVKIPLLRKDFIVSESQLIESVNRADAVLLIVKLLSKNNLSNLINFSYRLKLLPIVEVTNTLELNCAIKAGAKIIGVNSRDLVTLKINYDKALKTLNSVPKGILPLLFSGISTRENVTAAVKNGAKGILVGSSLIKSKNKNKKVKELIYD